MCLVHVSVLAFPSGNVKQGLINKFVASFSLVSLTLPFSERDPGSHYLQGAQ